MKNRRRVRRHRWGDKSPEGGATRRPPVRGRSSIVHKSRVDNPRVPFPFLGAAMLAAALSADQASQTAPAVSLTLQSAFTIAEEHNRTLVAARLGRAVDVAGVAVAGQRPESRSLVRGRTRHPPRDRKPCIPAGIRGQARAPPRPGQRDAGPDGCRPERAVARYQTHGPARVLRTCRRRQPRPGHDRAPRVRRTDPQCRARPVRVRRRAAARGAPGGSRAGTGRQRTGSRARTSRRSPSIAQYRAGPRPGCTRRTGGPVRPWRDPGRPRGPHRGKP